MGVTEDWMVTTEGQRNWTAAIEREVESRFNWNSKWGWMPEVMAEPIKKLKELREKQIARIAENTIDYHSAIVKDPRPLPRSTNHEYGWLATKPDYKIERFGPFPLTLKVRVDPTMQEIEEEIIKDTLNAPRKLEKRLNDSPHTKSSGRKVTECCCSLDCLCSKQNHIK